MFDFSTLSFSFNRALRHAYSLRKNLMAFMILALCGMLVIFFKGVALHTGHWVESSLNFLPIFICSGILLALGIFLIRLYHDEIKRKEVSFTQILSKSWETMLIAATFALPIILGYLFLWMLLGVFVMLGEIPVLGEFFSLVLAFAPFLINLLTLVLCLASFLILFFAAPIIALRGSEREAVVQLALARVKKDPFANVILLALSLLPLLIVLAFLLLAAVMTGGCLESHTAAQQVLKWFFIMLPFTALLAPAVVFFFNFAAEAHVIMNKST